MKKTAILSTQPILEVRIPAFVRISQVIAESIPNVTVISKDFELCRESFDNIIIAYGTYYARVNNMMLFIERNKDKRFFYLINEYGLVPNGDVYKFLVKNNYEILAAYEKGTVGAKHFSDLYSVNLNTTGYHDLEICVPFEKRDRDIIYWGRYRPDRKEYFDKYFKNMTVSASFKNRKFFNTYPIDLIDTLELNSSSVLNHYKFSLYIEDNYSHTHYTYPGARFYEALSFGLVQFFDKDCKNTFSKSIYNIDDFYFVSDRQELDDKIKEVNKYPQKHIETLNNLRSQALNEQKDTMKKIENILNSEKKPAVNTCPACNNKAYRLFKCANCAKNICSACLKIQKKHYCEECFGKIVVSLTHQTTLF